MVYLDHMNSHERAGSTRSGMRAFHRWSCMLLVLVVALPRIATSKDAPPVEFPAGSQVGILNLMTADFSHYAIGTTIFQNELEHIQVDWNLPGHVDDALRSGISARGYVPLVIEPPAPMLQRRTEVYRQASMFSGPGIPAADRAQLVEICRERGLASLVVIVTATSNQFWTPGGFFKTRSAVFPDTVTDWGVATRSSMFGSATPVVFNATVMLLLDPRVEKPAFVREAKGVFEMVEWEDSGLPKEPARDAATFAGARPILVGQFDRLVEQVLGGLAAAAPQSRPAEPPAAAVPATDAPATDVPPADAAPTESPKPADQP